MKKRYFPFVCGAILVTCTIREQGTFLEAVLDVYEHSATPVSASTQHLNHPVVTVRILIDMNAPKQNHGLPRPLAQKGSVIGC